MINQHSLSHIQSGSAERILAKIVQFGYLQTIDLNSFSSSRFIRSGIEPSGEQFSPEKIVVQSSVQFTPEERIGTTIFTAKVHH